jgi:hypothetical protein
MENDEIQARRTTTFVGNGGACYHCHKQDDLLVRAQVCKTVAGKVWYAEVWICLECISNNH